jgi:hypothetical protein
MTDPDALDGDWAPLSGPTGLVRMSEDGVDLGAYGATLLERQKRDPRDLNALMDLSTVIELRGDRATALAVQALALSERQFYRIRPTGRSVGIRLLALMAPGDLAANTPLEALVEDSDIELQMLYIVPGVPLPSSLPAHDVAFVAVGQSVENRAALQRIESLAQSWPTPLLNRPDRIAQLPRDRVSALLRGAPGLVAPETALVERARLERTGHGDVPLNALFEGAKWPILIRPVDSHGGRALVKIDSAPDIVGYLRDRPASELFFFVSRFIDYSGRDGLFRKYRVVLIDGKPFACHAAIDSKWMIHYAKVGMEDSPEKRAEEERFMNHFDDDFASRHRLAFAAIGDRLGLDYVTMDCGETRDGALLLFEADGNSYIHSMDSAEVFPYKQVQMRKVFGAFRDMLVRAMEGGGRA